MRDVLYSLRQFAKAPGFTFLAVLCLGLGIGVNTSIFSVLNSLFLRPMPVIAPDRLVVLSRGGGPLLSCPDFRDFRDRAVTLEGMAASLPTESSLDFDGLAHFAGAEAVSVNYPQVIGVRPFLAAGFRARTRRLASSATTPGSASSPPTPMCWASAYVRKRNGTPSSASRRRNSTASTCP